ncbi:MAG: adenylate/guanylate cyclase domain-containing protein [Chloroflexi bacterium]|nr:adenylate/guanylate cyclase domain-containing protein [Chloroflexota bacterium]MCH8052146.1 adenylate/guanylate cyclase domain-containing protein [Chloroflexota bacterium]
MTPAAAIETREGTIVFTDLSGFTEFTALRGDAAALSLLDLQERLVLEEMGDSGRIVKNLGDGMMLWFDEALDAVQVSIALQERFEEASGEDDEPLWVRIGIHFGRPVLRGSDFIGHDVNVAARIVDLAAPGEVLVSEACTAQIEAPLDGVVFEEIGPTIMKGIPEPVPLYRVMRSWDA